MYPGADHPGEIKGNGFSVQDFIQRKVCNLFHKTEVSVIVIHRLCNT